MTTNTRLSEFPEFVQELLEVSQIFSVRRLMQILVNILVFLLALHVLKFAKGSDTWNVCW